MTSSYILLSIVGNAKILQWDLMSEINICMEFRQKVCVYIHALVLLRDLPSLDGKLERFSHKKWGKMC